MMSSVYGTIGLRREGRPSQPKCCKSIAETDILGAADGDRARNKLGIKLASKCEVGMSRTPYSESLVLLSTDADFSKPIRKSKELFWGDP